MKDFRGDFSYRRNLTRHLRQCFHANALGKSTFRIPTFRSERFPVSMFSVSTPSMTNFFVTAVFEACPTPRRSGRTYTAPVQITTTYTARAGLASTHPHPHPHPHPHQHPPTPTPTPTHIGIAHTLPEHIGRPEFGNPVANASGRTNGYPNTRAVGRKTVGGSRLKWVAFRSLLTFCAPAHPG